MELAKVYNQPNQPVSPAVPTLQAKSVRVVRSRGGLFESLEDMRDSWRAAKGLSYAAARPSKFRRTRQGIGGSADAHYFNDLEFWQLREYARDMDRNDLVVQAMVDRAIDNIVGDGFMYDPATGDSDLDDELFDRWQAWAIDPLAVDLAGKFDFFGLEKLTLRHTAVDGDCCLVPLQTLQLQFFEGERLASPSGFDDIVHGIEVDPYTEAPLNYHFTRAAPGLRKLNLRILPGSLQSDTVKLRARREDGTPNVLHIFDPARYTQNRGVTWFKSVFDTLGMFEDINFARLVQQQMVSCVAMFITRERDYQWGSREEEDREDGTVQVFEEISPGLIARLKKGEKVEPFSPNVPNPDYLPFVRMILRLIGAAFGIPLEVILFDTTDTTFHGYRGALDQARQGFRRRQKWLETYLHRRVMQVLLRAWLPELGLRSAKLKRKLGNHVWRKPSWAYIDPKVDTDADRNRLRGALTSPRRLHAERNGVEWEDIQSEIIEDWGMAIEGAVKEAIRLNKLIPKDSKMPIVTWREVLNLDAPEGMTRQEKVQEMPDQPAGAAPAPKPKVSQ